MGIAAITLTGLFAVGGGTVRASYETAPYQVVRTEGKFELRDYPALVVVETEIVRTTEAKIERRGQTTRGQNTSGEDGEAGTAGRRAADARRQRDERAGEIGSLDGTGEAKKKGAAIFGWWLVCGEVMPRRGGLP